MSDRPTIDKRKAILLVGASLLLASGAFAAIGEVADFGRLEDAVRAASKAWFPLCLAGQLVAYGGYVLAYRDAARADGGPRFGLWTVTRIVVVGIGAVVLGATAGGLAVDFWALHRAGDGTHTAARRVLALGTLEFLVLSVYACLAAIAVLLGAGEGAPFEMTVGWLVVVPLCVLGAALCTSPRRVARLTRSVAAPERPHGRRPAAWLRWARGKARVGLADAIGGVVLVRHLLAHPLRYKAGAIGYPIYWLGDMLTLYAGLRAFDVHVGVAALVLAYATGFAITLLPLPAGGAGGVEASLAFALHAVGVALAPALLGVFVYRLFTFWLPILPALAFLPTLRQLDHELPETDHAPPDPDEEFPFRPREEEVGAEAG